MQTAQVSAVRVLPVMRIAGTCRARFKPRVTSSLEPPSSKVQLQNSANPIAESHHLSLCFPLPLSGVHPSKLSALDTPATLVQVPPTDSMRRGTWRGGLEGRLDWGGTPRRTPYSGVMEARNGT
ncbi:hypothetical protein CaCOL14_006487 [Colletotrichum acutatum]